MTGYRKEGHMLRFLYQTAPGRLLLKPISSRLVSEFCGAFLDSPLSVPLIGPFVRKNNIDLSEYYSENFRCFNDCFSRKIKSGYRPINKDPEALIAPCDGRLSAYRIRRGTVIPVKQSRYTIDSLLGQDPIAKKYEDGICLVFRLCVDNYHRYCYVDSGQKGENIFLSGKLHTVRPIALAHAPVFVQNCREYTAIETENFGTVIQMEVGAMLVGKIRNYHGEGSVRRGKEKGCFLYGGSTVILLLQKDSVHVPERIFAATEQQREIPVRMGEAIGRKKS